jgi:hypothetical protein
MKNESSCTIPRANLGGDIMHEAAHHFDVVTRHYLAKIMPIG